MATCADGRLAEHWDVIEDEATSAASVSGLPMFSSNRDLALILCFCRVSGCKTLRAFRRGAETELLIDRGVISFCNILPIHEIIDEGLEIIGPAIPVIDIIGMLPNIDGQNRRCLPN